MYVYMRKVDQFVRFPRTLDVSPFCHQESGEGADACVYELYGLVEHHGSMSGGHYVAYVAAGDSDGEGVRRGRGGSGIISATRTGSAWMKPWSCRARPTYYFTAACAGYKRACRCHCRLGVLSGECKRGCPGG